MSRKGKGADSILYNAVLGTAVTTGVLTEDTWYKIKAFGTASALPFSNAGQTGYIFKSPALISDAITLAAGDEVWPITMSEICKVDMEISGEMGVIDTADSCDYPYNTSIPDGYTNLSGSINTMMRFDEATGELVDVTKDFLIKFFNYIEDDGAGTYTLQAKDDSDLIFMTLLDKNMTAAGQIETWIIIPAILNSISNNVALKDVLKADYGWTKGQGPASYYQRTIVVS